MGDKLGVDLIICDTFGYFTKGVRGVTHTDRVKRGNYIKQVQELIKGNLKHVKRGKETGNVLVGVDIFSFSSLGEDLFKKENAKRALVWNRDLKGTKRGYTGDRAFYMWGVVDRGWIYHLQGDERFFRGEYLEVGEDFSKPEDVVRDMVRRFTNDGGKVLELILGNKTVVEQVVKEEGREYVGIEGDIDVGG